MIYFKATGKVKKLFIGILIGLAVSILSILIYQAGIFEPYELKTFDRMMRYLSKKTGSADIVIVEIDQVSLDSLKKEGITWPWPRQVYSPVINLLSRSGVKAIFFDLLFTEPSSYGKEDDEIFAESIKSAGNLYMPFFLSKEEGIHDDLEGFFLDRFSLKVDGKRPAEEYSSVILPIPEIIQSSKGMGNVQIAPDPDGIYRRIPLLFYYKGRWFSHICIAYLNNKSSATINLKEDYIQIGDRFIPHEKGLFRLNYYGGLRYYSRYPIVNLIRSYLDMEAGKIPELNQELFRDKYVFIGLTAPGLYDLKPTPISSIYPAVGIHATLLDNILRADYLSRIGRSKLFALIVVVSILSASLVIITPSLLRNMIFFAGFVLLLILSGVISFVGNILLDMISLSFSFTISFSISAVFSYSTEGRQKREIKQVFSHYMNESLVNELLKRPDRLRLGGEKRVLTVFFSDLQDFTSLSEKNAPDEIVRLLNIYLTEMTEIILNRGGIIDKYQGDGIMAFWGAPIKKDDDEIQACLAAIENQERLSELRKDFGEMGFPSLHARIGINTGEMIVGNMGSQRRFDYTVIGDNVNLASRLEAVNKIYSTKIIVGESTFLRARDHLIFRELDIIRVKGREEDIRIYELMGKKDDLSPEKIKIKGIFEEALLLYREKRWGEAMDKFGLCLKMDQTDGPSREYLRRCRELLKNQPLTEWDGIYIIGSK